MRTSVAVIFWFIGITCGAHVETLPEQNSHSASQDGGVREVLESIVIPPIPHAPFSATLATEAVKYAADGTTMTFVNERHIARDAQGRIYEERWFLVPKNGNVQSKMNWIQLIDPKQRTLYNCSHARHMCDLLSYDPASDLAAALPNKGSSGPMPHGDGNIAWEDLGIRTIAGIETAGTRKTVISNAGAVGNDQPLTSMSEYWHSAQFGINLLSIRSSPFFGRQTFTITELSSGDPDPQLFGLPAGFKVNDQRKSPPISY